MRFVTATRRLSALGVNALDRGYATEYPISCMLARAQQQPGDGTGFRRIGTGYKFACYVASVSVLPGRAGKVRSNRFAMAIGEFGFRSFQRPGEFLIGGHLANIYLRASSVYLQDNLLTCRSFDVVRNFGTRNLLSTCQGQNPSCEYELNDSIHEPQF